MPTQLLIYEKVTPLSRERHANWSLQAQTDYGYARHVNAVPLMTVEFSQATAEYPIVFTESQGVITPSVILGLKGNENLYLSPTNQWQARYIPAFVRRYPFVFALSEDKSTFTLCLDEAFPGFNQTGQGVRLLQDDGQPTESTQKILKFLQEFEVQYQRTQRFCRNLDELELLEPMQAQIVSPTGEPSALTGFLCVSRDRLRKLSGKSLARLAESDELELLYNHLYSLRNFTEVHQRLNSRPPA